MLPENLLARIRGEYRQMPDLRLTFAQARLLWQLDTSTCGQVLQMLVDEGFLVGRPDGRFVVSPTTSMPRNAITADQTQYHDGEEDDQTDENGPID